MDLRGTVFGTTYLSEAFAAAALSALCPTAAPFTVPGGTCAITWPSGGDSNLTQRIAAAATLAATATPPTGAHNREPNNREGRRGRGRSASATTGGSVAMTTLTRRASS